MKKIDFDKYQTFIFDCDGVILDSNNLKNSIFLKSVKEYSKKITIFEDYIKKNKGLSRYNFFKYFFKSIVKVDKIHFEKSYNKALKIYESELEKKYTKCDFVPGILKFLLKHKNKKKIVISGSNQQELIDIFKKRNIYNYFKFIYGSPKSKLEIASDFKKKNKENFKSIYFGDSYYDYKVAKVLKSDFVFIYGYSDDVKLFDLKIIRKYKDFTTI